MYTIDLFPMKLGFMIARFCRFFYGQFRGLFKHSRDIALTSKKPCIYSHYESLQGYYSAPVCHPFLSLVFHDVNIMQLSGKIALKKLVNQLVNQLVNHEGGIMHI